MKKDNDITLTRTGKTALLSFDVLDQKINVLRQQTIEELKSLVFKIEEDDTIDSVIIISGKPDNFIAGADIRQIACAESAAQASLVVKKAQELFDAISRSKKPYIAAINGSCFGGGLELALACHFRMATLDTKTTFAFLEVKLGLIPAAGGTQRLPRLIGLKKALDMLLTGRRVNARSAYDSGLLDANVGQSEELHAAAIKFAFEVNEKKRPKKKTKHLAIFALLRLCLAKKIIRKKTFALYPAPLAIIDAIIYGIIRGYKAGLRKEAELFGKLCQTTISKNLIKLFFAQKKREKNPYIQKIPPLAAVGIAGSGLMGTGIACVSLLGHFQVYLSDKKQKSLAHAESFIAKHLKTKVRKNILTKLEQKRLESNLFTSIDLGHFKYCDAIIEAVYEDLTIKQELLRKIEPLLKPDSIFASNTSSIPIASIAEHSRIKERVVGMHYFSPVNKVPLLEIVKSKYCSDEALAKACEIGVRQKRTMIIVNDSAGFYTTRVIAALLDEACILLQEGYEAPVIDEHLKSIGFPMGPIALMDEVGLDVGLHVSKTLYEHFGERLIAADLSLCEWMVKQNFLGRKTGQGFYIHDDHRQKVNRSFIPILHAQKNRAQKASSLENNIEQRMLLRTVNEAFYCLSENVIGSPDDGDVGAVFGIGFPAYLGGPFTYVQNLGSKKIAQSLDRFSQQLGPRFSKAPFFD